MDQLPFPADNPLALAPRYRDLQTTEPLTRVLTRAGDPAWLASGYDLVKELAMNPALGRSHPEPERAARNHNAALLGGPNGDFATEREQHQRMRRVLTPAFSAKRMRALEDAIGDRVDGILDSLGDPPVDLHAALSAPLPVLVICELLGAPYSDYERFRSWSNQLAGLEDATASYAAMEEFNAYTADLLERKRREPGEDVYTDLANAEGMGVEEAAQLAQGLLFAGHETTMTRIDLGVLLFIQNPDQKDKLLADPSLVDNAVEEIVRLTVGTGSSAGSLLRYAAEDISVGSTVIRRGEAVLLGFGPANRDPAQFDRPDEFDITRKPNPHVGFGHGPHFCIGNSLARIELRVVFARLFQRFPTLRLDTDELTFRHDTVTGGVTALPVTW